MSPAPSSPQSLAKENGPLVHELRPAPDPEAVFLALASRPHCLFLDSALRDPKLGRYSFITADPFEYVQSPANGGPALDQISGRLAQWQAAAIPDLPPFQGGAAGLLGYDLGRSLERLPPPAWDEFQLPALAIGFYDTVLAFDHARQRAWIISQGFPETEPARRRQRAAARLAQFLAWLREPPAATPPAQARREPPNLLRGDLAPCFPVSSRAELLSNFSAESYKAAVRRAIEYIQAGDIFQVNLAQRLLFPAQTDAVALYRRLRLCNPATFAGYFDLGESRILSASPERFVNVTGGEVQARPIKGTRRRTAQAEADLFAGDDLLGSEKDRAENVMIVDLLRNDLSRVCQPDSIRVTQLCGLESYQFVQHLVSVVHGKLAAGFSPLDVVRAAFPGGSITGAPKVRAMEIIAELEPTARGAYCGSLGYIGFDGALDLNILIRTITASRGWWQMPVGGGIVAQSNPDREYEETWHKAEGLLRAIG